MGRLETNGELFAEQLGKLGIYVDFVKAKESPVADTYYFNYKDLTTYNERTLKEKIKVLALHHHTDFAFKQTFESHFCIVENYPPKKISLTTLITRNNFKDIYLGISEDNKVTTLNFKDCPHLLIAGTTGSGKSVLIHNLLCNLYTWYSKNRFNKLQVVIIDPKHCELNEWKDCACTEYIDETKDAIQRLREIRNEMDYRYKHPESNYRDLFVIVDELASLMLASRYEVEESLVDLAQKGRACNIHLILATQRPTVDVVSGLIKANIPTRICLKVASIRDSINVLDHKGAETLLGYGDAYIKYPYSVHETRFQVAYPEKELEQKIIAINKRG